MVYVVKMKNKATGEIKQLRRGLPKNEGTVFCSPSAAKKGIESCKEKENWEFEIVSGKK